MSFLITVNHDAYRLKLESFFELKIILLPQRYRWYFIVLQTESPQVSLHIFISLFWVVIAIRMMGSILYLKLLCPKKKIL